MVSWSNNTLCSRAELYSHSSSSIFAPVARASHCARCSAGWLGCDGSMTTSNWRRFMAVHLGVVDGAIATQTPGAALDLHQPSSPSRLLKNYLRCRYGVKNRLKMLIYR